MNALKRFLSMFLVLCMLISGVPINAFAVETDSTESVETETTQETMVAVEEDMEAIEGTEDSYALTTLDLDADIATASISSITIGTMPSGGTTSKEPFPQGTAGSNSFRIPALVTLNNGNLLAAADARWNTTYDGGGLDTIVSVSGDNGDTWSYSFANYLGDNDNVYDGDSSTAFIDPALAVDGDTIYMLVDFYPYGVALNGNVGTYPSKAVGFNSDGKLLLSGNNHSSYDYYLNGTTIYSSDGIAVSGYTVDEYFNITETATGDTSNLFFSNSPYKVVRTGFLYLTKSTDGGQNWSAPELLNLKTSSEQVCLVAPGRGLVTGNGNVIFPVYSYNGSESTQTMSFITYDGKSWSRSSSMTGASWSSESAVVALKDGTMRFFYRNGTTNLCYVDYNNGWKTPVVMSDIDTNSNCQLSAITYGKTIGGKQVILVSCPTGLNELGSNQSGASYRLNGKIFAFTVESDGTMEKVGEVNVTSNDNQFMYSCLTELNDGTIGILYEDKENAWGTGDNCYYTMSYAEYDLVKDFGLTFDAADTEEDTKTEHAVSVSDEGISIQSATAVTEVDGLTDFVAYEVALTKDNTEYTGEATITLPLNGKFAEDVTLWGFVIETDGSITYVKEDVARDKENDTVTFKVPHFSTVGVTPAAEEVTITDTVKVRIPVGGKSETYIDTTGNYENVTTNVLPNGTYAFMTVKGVNGVEETTVSTSKTTELEAGETYIIRVFDTRYALSSNTGSGAWGTKTLAFESNTLTANTDHMWTIEAVEGGYKIKNSDGYLNLGSGNNTAYVGETGETFTLKYTDTGWTIRNQSGIYINALGGLTYYYSAGGWTGDGTRFDLYKVIAESPVSTEITFEGVSAGSTEAIVGTTQYNITVYEEKTININYQVNGTTVTTGALTVVSDATTVTLPSTVVDDSGNIYTVDNTTLDLTVTPYNVPVTLKEGVDLEVAVGDTVEIEVELTEGQYVKWTTEDDHYASVAGVYDTIAGAYTNTAVVVGNNVTIDESTVLVTGTVYDSNGTVTGINKWLVTVTESTSTNTTSKYIYINIPRIQNCTIYYSVNAGEIHEVTDDMLDGPYTDDNGTYYKLKTALVDEQYTGGYQISFFAKPDEGYALTYMSSTNSAAEYYVLSDGDNPDGTDSSAWPFVSSYDWSGFDTLTTKPAGSNTAVWYTNRGLRWGLIEGNFTVAQLRVMLTNALALGCDGTLVFTKNAEGTANGSTTHYGNNDLVTDLAFIAEKLPEMYKKLSKVSYVDENGNTIYVDADDVDTIGIGYTLHYTIYVAVPKVANGSSGSIAYEDYVVTDELTEDTWLVSSANSEIKATSFRWNDSTVNVKAYGSADAWKNPLTDGSVTTFPIDSFTYQNSAGESITYSDSISNIYAFNSTLTLGASNFLSVVTDGTITNIAELEYDYQGKYSNGALDKVSNAVIDVLVEVPEYVIDFGLPVEIDLSDDPLVDGDKIVEAKANYGTVNITGDRTIVYTPTKILQGTDFIVLTFYDGAATDGDNANSNAIIGYGVRIYPATTVYYEEDFLLTDANWEFKGTDLNAYQSTVELDSAGNNNYGYDAAYADDGASSSNGTYMSSNNSGTASFTFTGTGFELYANSNAASGYVTVYSKGELSKLYMVNTVLSAGDTTATDQQTGGTYYSLPIISETDLPYGTYTVQVKQTKGEAPIYIDSVRIINTLEDSSIFTIDEEDKPVFHELRDYVLNAIGVEDLTKSDYIDSNDRVAMVEAVKDLSGQVYNSFEADQKAIIINTDGTTFTEEQAQDLLDNGPKNEVYLYPGQMLAFSVSTDRVMQLGMKSPTGSAKFKLTVDNKELDLNSLSTTVDMFYKIAAKGGTTHTVSIAVTEGVLSVTDLKICDDPNAAFTALTQEDVENVMLGMYDLLDEDTPTDEDTTVDEEESTEPETPETEEPDESDKDEQIKNPATLNITYVNLFGKKIGTAVITKDLASNESCRVSAYEIMAEAPKGRIALRLTSVKLKAGEVKNIVVPVIW